MSWFLLALGGLVLLWLSFKLTHWWITRGVWNRD
jgi:hypothetical protein